MLEHEWIKRGEHRRMREEARIQTRDSFLATLLNKISQEICRRLTIYYVIQSGPQHSLQPQRAQEDVEMISLKHSDLFSLDGHATYSGRVIAIHKPQDSTW